MLTLLAVGGCFLNDDLQKTVALKFSYCRINNHIVLGLRAHNNGTSPAYLGAKQLHFLVNGKESDPILCASGAWRNKTILPGSPKGAFGYFDIHELAEMLSIGTNTLHWQYGTVRSNAIILDVTRDRDIREIEVECEDRVRHLATSHAEMQNASNMLEHWYQTNHLSQSSIKIRILDAGIYALEQRYTPIASSSVAADIMQPVRKAVLLTQTNVVPARAGTTFGCRFVFEDLSTNAHVDAVVIVRHPPIAKTEETPSTIDTVKWRYPVGQEVGYTYTFDQPWEMAAGEWIIEIWHKGEQLAERKFVVQTGI